MIPGICNSMLFLKPRIPANWIHWRTTFNEGFLFKYWHNIASSVSLFEWKFVFNLKMKQFTSNLSKKCSGFYNKLPENFTRKFHHKLKTFWIINLNFKLPKNFHKIVHDTKSFPFPRNNSRLIHSQQLQLTLLNSISTKF